MASAAVIFWFAPHPLQKFQFSSILFFENFFFCHPLPLAISIHPLEEVWIFHGTAQCSFMALKVTVLCVSDPGMVVCG